MRKQQRRGSVRRFSGRVRGRPLTSASPFNKLQNNLGLRFLPRHAPSSAGENGSSVHAGLRQQRPSLIYGNSQQNRQPNQSADVLEQVPATSRRRPGAGAPVETSSRPRSRLHRPSFAPAPFYAASRSRARNHLARPPSITTQIRPGIRSLRRAQPSARHYWPLRQIAPAPKLSRRRRAQDTSPR